MSVYIPLTNVTVTTTPYLINIGQDYTVNITAVNSPSDNLLVTCVNGRGQQAVYTVYAGNNSILKKVSGYQISFAAAASSTIFTAVISWPDEIDPASLQVTGTIKTDIGQRADTLTGTNPVVPPSPLPTDIGQLDTYGKDATLATINTSLTPTTGFVTDIGHTSSYAKDATVSSVNTTLGSPAQDASVKTINTTLGSPFQANGSVGLITSTNTNNGFTGTIATTGTAQQLTTTSTVVQHFQIRNTSTTGNVQYVGSSGAQSLLLYPNGMFLWDANPNEQTDISTWYVNGTAADTYAVNYQV